MTEVNISVITNSFIPDGCSIDLTVYQRLSGEVESGNTDPSGRAYDQKDTVSLSGGANEFNRANIPYRQGSETWFLADFESDGAKAPALDSVVLRPSLIADVGSVQSSDAIPKPNLTKVDSEVAEAEVTTLQRLKRISWTTEEDFDNNQFSENIEHEDGSIEPVESVLLETARIVVKKKSPEIPNGSIPENSV